ncbi:MAG: Ig-like domain-containing protein [Polyangiaceae bacterium]
MNRGWASTLLLLVACGGDGTTTTGSGGAPPGAGGAGGVGGEGGTSAGIGGGIGVGGMAELPETFIAQGLVVDEDGTPIAGAFVVQGGKTQPPLLQTGSEGTFSLEVTSKPGVPGIVATKQGYRSAGWEFYELPTEPISLTLHSVKPEDNQAYPWGDPGMGQDPSTLFCGHCHERFAAELVLSKHDDAAKNPLVQQLYAGVGAFNDAASCAAAGGQWRAGATPGDPSVALDKCYLGDGVLPDLNPQCGGTAACDDPALPSGQAPTTFGACADCHAPAIDGALGGRNLHDATGLAFDRGVFCDLCHKVSDVDLAAPPGVAGRLVIRRPIEPSPSPVTPWRPLVFGPLLDVPNGFMGASYQPLFSEATYCAGCHQQDQPALVAGQSLDAQRWPNGLPVHSTYEEWLAGPYAAAGVPCQFCHMPAHFDMNNSIGTSTPDNASITFGYPRPPQEIREHIFRGPLYQPEGDLRLVDTALFADVTLAVQGSEVEATVSLANVGCGHAVPTGEPMRSLVLVVEARGTGCGARPAVGGYTVFDIGGAHADDLVGGAINAAGSMLTWVAGAAAATPGMVVRAVRASGGYDDYPGVGFFADPGLPPAEKGLPILEPVGMATVVAVGSGQLTLDVALPLQSGDRVYLGDALTTLQDGDPSRALAGAAGHAFARVLTAADGRRQVPHHLGVDIASDNRIPPGSYALSQHRFALDQTCSDVTVEARVLYRPHPLAEAKRGWAPKDYLVATASETTTLP